MLMSHYWVLKQTMWIQNEEDVADQCIVVLLPSLMLKWTFIEYYYVPGTELIGFMGVLFNTQQSYKVNRITVPTLWRCKKLKT